MNRSDRLYAIAEALRAAGDDGRTGEWLAERFEVTTRTIKRDITALQEAGRPILGIGGRGGGYWMDPAATLPPIAFTSGEAIAIATLMSVQPDAPYAVEARRALAKVLGAMVPGGGARCDGPRRARVDPAPRRRAAAVPGGAGGRGGARPPGRRRPRLPRRPGGRLPPATRRTAGVRQHQGIVVPDGVVPVAAGRTVVPARPHRAGRPDDTAGRASRPHRGVRSDPGGRPPGGAVGLAVAASAARTRSAVSWP